MPNRKPDKPKITPELKQDLIKRVAELKLEGKSNKFIADELGICWGSVDNYWKIHLDELLIDRQQVTERLIAKAVREHYEGKIPIKDVETAMNLAVRDEMKAIRDRVVEIPAATAQTPTLPRKEKPSVDGDTRTWGEFFRMVGIEATSATEAQKKENIEIRTQ
jgi:hypothetical protein